MMLYVGMLYLTLCGELQPKHKITQTVCGDQLTVTI